MNAVRRAFNTGNITSSVLGIIEDSVFGEMFTNEELSLTVPFTEDMVTVALQALHDHMPDALKEHFEKVFDIDLQEEIANRDGPNSEFPELRVLEDLPNMAAGYLGRANQIVFDQKSLTNPAIATLNLVHELGHWAGARFGPQSYSLDQVMFAWAFVSFYPDALDAWHPGGQGWVEQRVFWFGVPNDAFLLARDTTFRPPLWFP